MGGSSHAPTLTAIGAVWNKLDGIGDRGVDSRLTANAISIARAQIDCLACDGECDKLIGLCGTGVGVVGVLVKVSDAAITTCAMR